MTEVTRHNFNELLPEIEHRIKSCNFVCIDAEYTGLYAEDIEDSNSLFDTPAKRYLKLRNKIANKYSICQVGLAFFEKDIEDPFKHIVNAYNFYVFPVAFDTFAKREIASMQVSCLNYLARHNFDFNKFIIEGIPYLNKEKATAAEKFLKVNRHFMHTCDYLDPTLFPNKKPFLNDNDIQEIVEHLQGFSKIITIIQKSKKPLIGHNLLLDLILLYRQFYAELPDNYLDFKKCVHELFPDIYDTKCVAWGINFLRQQTDPEDRALCDTNLFSLYTNCSTLLQNSLKPFIQTANDATMYQEALFRGLLRNLESVPEANCHSAGFDATVTGAVFLKLGFLANRSQNVPEHRLGLPPTVTEIFSRVLHWKNEINISRCVVSHINLSQPDPESRRPDWIRVHSGEKKVDPVWLRGQLAKYGDVDIVVVNQDEVIIACSGYGCARKVWQILQNKGLRLSKQKVSSSSSELARLTLRYGLITASIIAGLYVMYRKRL